MPEMSIARLALDDSRWSAFVSQHPDATPFHHPSWAGFLADCYGMPAFALAQISAAGEVEAGLPVIEVEAPAHAAVDLASLHRPPGAAGRCRRGGRPRRRARGRAAARGRGRDRAALGPPRGVRRGRGLAASASARPRPRRGRRPHALERRPQHPQGGALGRRDPGGAGGRGSRRNVLWPSRRHPPASGGAGTAAPVLLALLAAADRAGARNRAARARRRQAGRGRRLHDLERHDHLQVRRVRPGICRIPA